MFENQWSSLFSSILSSHKILDKITFSMGYFRDVKSMGLKLTLPSILIWQKFSLISIMSKSNKKHTKTVRKLLTPALFCPKIDIFREKVFSQFFLTSIFRKHFWKRLFVSCKLLICLAKKSALNTKFCQNLFSWRSQFDNNFKKLKKKQSTFRLLELFFVSCRFLICLTNKTAWNTKYWKHLEKIN